MSKLKPSSLPAAAESLRLPNSINPQGRFNAFSGVFTPSILTILGVVMYLRFGWVVGHAGLTGALVIVLLSHGITTATGLSISTIATNRTVGAGGAYNIISRSLGAPIGAAIGLPLFFAQALSVSFYCVGFSESLLTFFPAMPFRLVTSLVCAALLVLSLKSASLVLKAQYFIMGAIAVSLISFFAGTGQEVPAETSWQPIENHQPFAAVFAVFFPAVTGIMAGVGMSGDLRNPRRALPLGTLAAIAVGLVVYSAFPFWLAANASAEQLANEPDIVWQIAAFPSLIYLGMWGATLSSAIGSLLTAPRTLQAIAMDRLVPELLGKGHGAHNEPRLATVLTFAIALGGIWLGNLDTIANTLTMFFLATYGLTNLACGVELWAASPNFRPQFRIPWWVSALGALACFYVMSLIDPLAMIVALVVCGLIYAVTQQRVLDTAYGDARHGFWSALVRSALRRMRHTDFHPENWRPNLLIMGGDVERRNYLLELGDDIVQHRGMVTYFELLIGGIEANAPRRQARTREIEPYVREAHPNVFYRVDVVESLHRGVVQAAQSYGLGNFEANTLMLGWPHKPERYQSYAQMMRELVALDKSLLLVHHQSDRGFGQHQQIHIWWGGLQGNGGLMLLTAFLLTAQPRWRDAEVTLITAVNTETQKATAERRMAAVIKGARVKAQPRVVLRNNAPIADVMRRHSAGADLAIIGISLPNTDSPIDEYFARMGTLLGALPSTVLVFSARNFPGEPVLFQR